MQELDERCGQHPTFTVDRHSWMLCRKKVSLGYAGTWYFAQFLGPWLDYFERLHVLHIDFRCSRLSTLPVLLSSICGTVRTPSEEPVQNH